VAGNRTRDVSDSFDCDVEKGMEYYTYYEDVVQELNKMGFVARPRPCIEDDHETIYRNVRSGDFFDGRLPTVIRTLSLDQLSALYSLFSNWYGYVSYQFKLCGAKRSEAKRQKEFLWSLVRDMKKIDPDTGKNRTDQQRSDAARFDVRFVEASGEYERLNAMYEVMEAVVNIAEQDLKTISREVTIKQTALEKERLRVDGARAIGSSQFRTRRTPKEDSDGEDTPTKGRRVPLRSIRPRNKD